jgi:hypothetical protein
MTTANSKMVDLKTFLKRQDFRNLARSHLANAKLCMAEADERYLFYATLELRKCIEAVIYETAKPYVDDISHDDFSTWQPGRLLAMLLEIDPMADRSGEVRLAREDGDEPQVWRSLGTDARLTLSEIRENYDALGFYLHTLTIHQLFNGKTQKLDRLKRRCDGLVVRLVEVLSQRIWNFNMTETATLDCGECGAAIKRRIGKLNRSSSEGGEQNLTVNCFNCVASYQLSITDDGSVLWDEELEHFTCSHDGCEQRVGTWKRNIGPGTRVKCSKCEGVTVFGLGMFPEVEMSEEKD